MFPLRDIVLTVMVLGLLPRCYQYPWIGVLTWAWLGYMNPHRHVWGFARHVPWAQLVAIVVLAGLFMTKDRKPVPWMRETLLLAALWAMFSVTTVFSLYPAEAWPQWSKASKVLLFTFITMMLFQDKARLRWLFLVIALSLGVYGLKGGIFGVLSGGSGMVLGPEGSFFSGNNPVAVVMMMAMPFLYYLQDDEPRPWLRHLLRVTFYCSIAAVIFTYSRGAMIGLPFVLGLLFLRGGGGRRTLAGLGAGAAFGLVFLVLAPVIVPEKWWDKMATIQDYEEVGSAQSRLKAWRTAFLLALDRPLVGGGFNALEHEEIYTHYGAAWGKHSAHSIYFGIIGDHGFIAFGLFVALLASCFVSLFWLRRTTRSLPSADWFKRSTMMVEASLAAYAISGAFLTLAYFDLFYHLVSIVVLLKVVANQEHLAQEQEVDAPASVPTRQLGLGRSPTGAEA